MYQASVPVFVQILSALIKIIDKAAAHAAAKKIDPAVLLGTRLTPDMFPLARQFQLASDFAKNGAGRIAGVELPKYPDEEKSFDQLKARLEKTIAFLKGLTPAQIEGSEGREVSFQMGGKPVTFTGEAYLLSSAMPNFYFHATTAYAILRQSGVEVGKRDFLGMA